MPANVSAREENGLTLVSVSGLDGGPQTPAHVHADLVRLIANSRYKLVLNLSGHPPTDLEAVLTDVRTRVERRRGWIRVVSTNADLAAYLRERGWIVYDSEQDLPGGPLATTSSDAPTTATEDPCR
jgi:hypothetical protein